MRSLVPCHGFLRTFALQGSATRAPAEPSAHAVGVPEFGLLGQRCLELGAGTGLLGLVAARCGAASVLLTDRASLVPLLQRNIGANQLGGRCSAPLWSGSCAAHGPCLLLSAWPVAQHHAHREAGAGLCCTIVHLIGRALCCVRRACSTRCRAAAQELTWGLPDSAARARRLAPVDCVLCADCVYCDQARTPTWQACGVASVSHRCLSLSCLQDEVFKMKRVCASEQTWHACQSGRAQTIEPCARGSLLAPHRLDWLDCRDPVQPAADCVALGPPSRSPLRRRGTCQLWRTRPRQTCAQTLDPAQALQPTSNL